MSIDKFCSLGIWLIIIKKKKIMKIDGLTLNVCEGTEFCGAQLEDEVCQKELDIK